MYGNKTEHPTKNYRYGARRPDNVAAVDEQMKLAHRYHNQVIALERQRRTKVNEILAEIWPDLAPLTQRVEDYNTKIDELRKAIRQRNVQNRKRMAGTKEERVQIKE